MAVHVAIDTAARAPLAFETATRAAVAFDAATNVQVAAIDSSPLRYDVQKLD